MGENAWDEQINAGWSLFQNALSLALASLTDDDSITLELRSDGPRAGVRPYLQVLRTGDDFLLEVSSNEFLSPDRQLDLAAQLRLADLGFSQPTEEMPNHWLLDGENAVAQIAVQALRDVLGVIHPVFLAGTPIAWQPEPPAAETLVSQPTGPDHLKALINETLTRLIGADPERDQDGDIPIHAGHSIVYVLPHPTAPVVRILALMAVGITHKSAAHRAVAA